MSRPGDLDPMVAALTGGAWLCGDCIAGKVGAPLWKVHNDLAQLSKRLTIISAIAQCHGCEQQASVHRLG